MRLPIGVLVDMSCVAAGESMLWWPSESESDAGVSNAVEQLRAETAAKEKVSLAEVAPVEGVLLRQSVGLKRQRGERIQLPRRNVREWGGGVHL